MRAILFGNITLLLLLASGCHAPTETDRGNRRAVDELLTAITLKNTRLIDEVAERAIARHDLGQLSDAEYSGLGAIIAKARAGDWPGAEHDGYAFRKQHPFVREGQ